MGRKFQYCFTAALLLVLALAYPVWAADAEKLFAEGEDFFFARKYEQARDRFMKAADQGHAKANTCLGIMYADGLGVKKDEARAIEFWKKAAAQGDPLAQNILATSGAANAPSAAQPPAQTPPAPPRISDKLADEMALDFLGSLGKALSDATEPETEIEFENNTDKDIYVAVVYESLRSGWVCEGWLKVPPGWLNPASFYFTTKNGYFYYYAESSVGHHWSDPDGPLITVIDDDFSYNVDESKCPEGPNRRNVRFREMYTNDYLGEIELYLD